MSLGFDGLRTILGNSAVAVPDVEAAAIEQPVVSVTPVAPPPASDPELDGASGSHEFSDIPGLADLDRGVYRPSTGRSRDDPSAALDAPDRGLFATAASRGTQTPAPSSSSRPVATIAVQRDVNGWAAAAIMAFGLALGATAAAAVFHDDVSRIVASWERAR